MHPKSFKPILPLLKLSYELLPVCFLVLHFRMNRPFIVPAGSVEGISDDWIQKLWANKKRLKMQCSRYIYIGISKFVRKHFITV